MKKILKFVFSFIGFIYLVLAVFAIVCLLKKNDFGYPQFNTKTLIVIDENSSDSYYKKGDLVILNKPDNKDVGINDAVFFYDTEFKKNTLNVGNVTSKDIINENEVTYHVSGTSFSSDYLVGKVSDCIRYPFIGTILNILISKWGFFFVIIIPFFIMFMMELFAIYAELKYGSKK